MSVAAKATGTQDLWHFQEAAEGSVWLKWGLSEEEGRRRAQRERRAGVIRTSWTLLGDRWKNLGSS